MKKSRLLAGVMVIGVSLAGILAVAPAMVHAQSAGSGQTGGSVAFVRDAGSAGHFEIQGARLALERSQNVGVRGYATQTLKDATEMVNRVKFINESNVSAPMPRGPSDAQQATLNRLAGLNGPDFDRASTCVCRSRSATTWPRPSAPTAPTANLIRCGSMRRRPRPITTLKSHGPHDRGVALTAISRARMRRAA